MSAPMFRRATHDVETGEFLGHDKFRVVEDTQADSDGGLLMHLIDGDWWSFPLICAAAKEYAGQFPENVGEPESWTNTRVWEALCCAVWTGRVEVRDDLELQDGE